MLFWVGGIGSISDFSVVKFSGNSGAADWQLPDYNTVINFNPTKAFKTVLKSCKECKILNHLENCTWSFATVYFTYFHYCIMWVYNLLLSTRNKLSPAMRKPEMLYANNTDADKPAHPRSLISVFVIRCLDSIINLVSVSYQKCSRL